MPPDPSDVALVVLAGGEGSRMGQPKGLLTIAGRPILSHILDRIQWDGPTLLVTAPGREHPPGWNRFTAELVDPVAGLGPLRGIVTALESGRCERFVFVPVDMPCLLGGSLRWLVGQHDLRRNLGLMTQRIIEGKPQIEPMPLVLRVDALPILRTRLESGRRSIHGLAAEAGFDVVAAPTDWGEPFWTNLNSPDELEEISRKLRS